MADTEITFSEAQAGQLAALLDTTVEGLTAASVVAGIASTTRTLARHRGTQRQVPIQMRQRLLTAGLPA